jgi:predicted DNA-binding transcriptional regulator AlpA
MQGGGLSAPAKVPSLDELAADLTKAGALPPEVARLQLVRVAALHAALQVAATASPPATSHQAGGDRFLDAAEVGAMVGKSVSWIEKHTEELPKRRRVGGEAKWSRDEIIYWMRHRPPWD